MNAKLALQILMMFRCNETCRLPNAYVPSLHSIYSQVYPHLEFPKTVNNMFGEELVSYDEDLAKRELVEAALRYLSEKIDG
jgi:hypothetical protein